MFIYSMDSVSWDVIDKYFKDNPNNLVAHHLDSYNDFFSKGIFRIVTENNPIRYVERIDDGTPNECLLYIGGKNGDKLYFGKPIIYDEVDATSYIHYMYPNDARLRNMTYGITIHYDVDVVFNMTSDSGEPITKTQQLEKIYMGKFPIMLNSNLCILKGLTPEVKYNMGECRNDSGGYFIIGGK